jgi:hypothetical protein
MATKRTRILRRYEAPVSDAVIHLLRTGDLPEKGPGWFEAFEKSRDPHSCRTDTGLFADWQIVRDEILEDWIDTAPGSRPWAWWVFDAPRWTGPFPERCAPLEWYMRKIAEPRRRVGGVGTPSHEVLNVWPHFSFGLPTAWVSAFQESYYNGRARDIHGERIGTEYHDGHFAGLAPRPADLPRFESEPTYLERHGLLTPDERRLVPAEAFEPEAIAAPEADAAPDVKQSWPNVFATRVFDETRKDGGWS